MKIKMHGVVLYVFLFFVLIKSFSGVVGLVFQPLNYVPTILMLLLIMKAWVLGIVKNPKYLLSFILIIIYYLLGIMNFGFLQATFGLYLFIPFIFCLTYSDLLVPYVFSGKNKFYYFIFVSACIGIWFVSAFGAPWLGEVVTVGGVDKVISRDWTSGGILRNPGFTAASFDVATLLMISSFFIIYNSFRENKKIRALCIFAISLYFIYLTTTKTTVVTMILAIVLLATPVVFSKIAIKLMVFISIVFSYIYMIPEIKYDSYDPKNTLLMRMYSTWPRAIQLLNDEISIWIGKGFGSIGTAAQYFSPDRYSPGDNILVYLYVISGFFSIILTLIFFMKFIFVKFYDRKFEKSYYVLSFCILIGGVTYNLFESVFYSIALGVVVGCVFDKKLCYTSNYTTRRKILNNND